MTSLLESSCLIVFLLIGNLRCFKEAKLMDINLDKCIFQNRLLNFSNICFWYTSELPNSVLISFVFNSKICFVTSL